MLSTLQKVKKLAPLLDKGGLSKEDNTAIIILVGRSRSGQVSGYTKDQLATIDSLLAKHFGKP